MGTKKRGMDEKNRVNEKLALSLKSRSC